MDTNNGNNKKSKIEQIRIDLEKKFEALEKARLKKIESKKSNEDIKENISEEIKSIDEVVKRSEVVKLTEELKVEEVDDSESVEIVLGERIVTEEDKEVSFEKSLKEDVVDVDLLRENINQKSENIEKEVSAVVASSVLDTDFSREVEGVVKKTLKENIDVERGAENNKKIEVVPNQKEVLNAGVLDKDEDIEVNEEEEESKSSKLGYFIYGLAGILLLVAGYFLLDFFKETKTFEQEKMEMLISKYKNKSYLDSIELVDANNQLLDFQNQQFIDSISKGYELELKAGDKEVARNRSRNNNRIDGNNSRDRKNERERQASIDAAAKEVKLEVARIKVKEAPLSIGKEKTVSNVEVKDTETDSSSDKDEVEEVDKEEVESKEDKSKERKDGDEKLEVAKEVGLTRSPIYPGCAKKRSEVEKKKCLTSKMLRHIQRKFNSDLVQDVGLKQGINKIKVSFVVDKNGYANVLQVRTDNKRLEKEAIRVIQSLPKMTPGRVNGKTSQMKYVIPIQFKVRN